MSRGWKRRLTEEAELDREEFEASYGGFSGQGCTCFLSPPCGFCTHPGNPRNQEEDDSAWEWISPGAQAQIGRTGRNLARTLRGYVGRRVTHEMAATMQRCATFGPRTGWGRATRKRAKLEMRGTYRRRDQWALDRSAKRIREIAEGLAQSINDQTGSNIDGAEFLKRFGDGMPAIIISTPMNDQDASKFRKAWEEGQRKAPLYTSMSMEVHPGQEVIGHLESFQAPGGEPVQGQGRILRPIMEQADRIPTPGPNGELPPGWKAVPRYAVTTGIARLGSQKYLVGVDIVREEEEEGPDATRD